MYLSEGGRHSPVHLSNAGRHSPVDLTNVGRHSPVHLSNAGRHSPVHLTNVGRQSSIHLSTVICKSLRPDMIFKPFYCYDVRLFNFMFLLYHPISVEEEYKNRNRIF